MKCDVGCQCRAVGGTASVHDPFPVHLEAGHRRLHGRVRPSRDGKTSFLLASNAPVGRPSLQPVGRTSTCFRRMRLLHPQESVSQFRVVGWHEDGPGGLERVTRASAPSAKKIEMVTPPDNIALTVCARTLPLRKGVVPALRRYRLHFHC